jgi:hypothetical protein
LLDRVETAIDTNSVVDPRVLESPSVLVGKIGGFENVFVPLIVSADVVWTTSESSARRRIAFVLFVTLVWSEEMFASAVFISVSKTETLDWRVVICGCRLLDKVETALSVYDVLEARVELSSAARVGTTGDSR